MQHAVATSIKKGCRRVTTLLKRVVLEGIPEFLLALIMGDIF
ncbi:hypothetical protein [Chitinophaga rhizophila]|nr:hypothetical protein [Chitinophaga rhizophila]